MSMPVLLGVLFWGARTGLVIFVQVSSTMMRGHDFSWMFPTVACHPIAREVAFMKVSSAQNFAVIPFYWLVYRLIGILLLDD